LCRRAAHFRSVREQAEDQLAEERVNPGILLQKRARVRTGHVPSALCVLMGLDGRRVLTHGKAIGRHAQRIEVISRRGRVITVWLANGAEVEQARLG
jgi:hypothetical protein